MELVAAGQIEVCGDCCGVKIVCEQDEATQWRRWAPRCLLQVNLQPVGVRGVGWAAAGTGANDSETSGFGFCRLQRRMLVPSLVVVL